MSLPEPLSLALRSFVREDRVLLASDFDGVLAPFADDPSQVRPLPGAIAALQAVQVWGDAVAVVSGRHLASLTHASGLAPDGPITLIGSHGAECSRPLDVDAVMDHAARARLAATAETLQRVADRAGARVEHKPSGVVLHTRGLPPARAEAASTAALTIPDRIAGVHAMRGKDVIELSVLEVSKGQALKALSSAVGADAVLYLGDDVTDETVFRALSRQPRGTRHVTVKVGPGDTAATHRIDGPPQAVEVLRTVARWRTGT